MSTLTPRREWRNDAACVDLSPTETDRVFFSKALDSIAEQQALCTACTVRSDCQLFQANIQQHRRTR